MAVAALDQWGEAASSIVAAEDASDTGQTAELDAAETKFVLAAAVAGLERLGAVAGALHRPRTSLIVGRAAPADDPTEPTTFAETTASQPVVPAGPSVARAPGTPRGSTRRSWRRRSSWVAVPTYSHLTALLLLLSWYSAAQRHSVVGRH